MAHRKLQQEIDRVFKKINEGLEIFDTYYERHENCTSNPSQKDKLESDLKREVKKLQRLREQIKSWQSSPDIKDKDSLLDYRRSVEIAMEKYKAVEKASKEKAYSNISLKKSDLLDPKERERRDVSDFLSNSIEELERQYDALQVEVDKLILLNKKRKTASPANDEKKEKLKAFQSRYRWHQQQMELALRLLANEELDPENVREIQEDINYFVDSSQDPDFVEDETIYDLLNLQSNEAIAHEVAQYFASQQAEDAEDDEGSSSAREGSKLSKKEQRRLEREARKAAKTAAKAPEADNSPSNGPGSPVLSTTSTATVTTEISDPTLKESSSPSPALEVVDTSHSVMTTAPSTAKSPTGLGSAPSTANTEVEEHQVVHTHIHQSQNGITTTSTLKPATVPVRPAGDLKWAVAASQGVEKDKKNVSHGTTASANVAHGIATGSTTGSSAMSSRANSAANTPKSGTPSLATPTLGQHLEKSVFGNSTSSSAATAAAVLAAGAAAVSTNNKTIGKSNSSSHSSSLRGNETHVESNKDIEERETDAPQLVADEYQSDLTDDELDQEPRPEKLTSDEVHRRAETKEKLRKEFIQDFDMLVLPSGIQEFIMGAELFENDIEALDGKLGGYRRSRDECKIPRFDDVPAGVNPPAPLDAFRSTEQWDILRCSLRPIIQDSSLNGQEKYEAILENFRSLEMFPLFYNYYFAVTPLEQEIASIILSEREWRVSKNCAMWFLRQSETKFANETCEIADYKIFKLDDWTVIDRLNFKLDYAALKTPPNESPAQEQSSREPDALSHGQQLLQQLKQGKSGILA
ncbi:NOT3 (YIL038C) [Zygosaccharomyces parabailii]|nr:NOT3 (YIL038C) [Zygosaccharomyces parabailii]CDH09085.1 related to General negative regulator of transcription subunit 3 [Zygosaccharomyces bailii ISA1307]